MPQHVWGDPSPNSRPYRISGQSRPYRLFGKSASKPVMEEVAIAVDLLDPKCAVVLDGCKRFLLTELEDSLPSSFAKNPHPSSAQVHIFIRQVAHLRNPSPSGEEGLQNGNVPHERAVGVGAGVRVVLLEVIEIFEETPKVGQGDGAGKATGLFDPYVHLAEGVDGYQVLPLEEVEEGFQSRHLALDALLLEGAEEALDVGAESGFVHRGEGGDLQVGGEVFGELAEIDRVGFEGLGAEVLLVAAVEKELRDGLL